jgi:NAD(P)-dependent dehydrogenase (short-subunit alcohol dehydrogenase family)
LSLAAGRPLGGRACLVAGGSRGVGRGIALALGEAGASVIVTGRSSEAAAATDGRPETIE